MCVFNEAQKSQYILFSPLLFKHNAHTHQMLIVKMQHRIFTEYYSEAHRKMITGVWKCDILVNIQDNFPF